MLSDVNRPRCEVEANLFNGLAHPLRVRHRLAYPQVADLLRVAGALLAELLQATERQLVEQSALPDLPPAATAATTDAPARWART